MVRAFIGHLSYLNVFQTRLQTIQSSVDRYATAGPLETIAEEEELTLTKTKGD